MCGGRVMEISVVIEPAAGNGYRATWGGPGMVAEGKTRDEALEALRLAIEKRMSSGAALVTLQVPDVAWGWLRYEGAYENDPLFDEWQQAIAEYRRDRD